MGRGVGDLPAGCKEEAITGGRQAWMLGVGSGAARGWQQGQTAVRAALSWGHTKAGATVLKVSVVGKGPHGVFCKPIRESQ